MSLTLNTRRFRRVQMLSPLGLWRAARDALARMERASALRRELEHMDAHMLSDIGVSRAQLQFEVDRKV
jgi:uncharacterized protein YjiS (DUF1127 family)